MCANEDNLQHQAYGSLPWQNFNNMISSVKVNFPDSTTVMFYDDANYVNWLASYGKGSLVSYVGDARNDRFGSAYNGVACCN